MARDRRSRSPAAVSMFVRRRKTIEGQKARAVELICHTATRTSEVLHANVNEFDLEARTWTIPAERTKVRKHTGEPFVVPLTNAAIDCLKRIELKPGERLFDLADRALQKLQRRLVPGTTVHGWRSTFRDWTAHHNISRELSELCLNHQVGNAVERAYWRTKLLDQRRTVMQAWSDYLESKTVAAEKVVKLRRARCR